MAFLLLIFLACLLYLCLKREVRIIGQFSSPLFLITISNVFVLILYLVTQGVLGFHKIDISTPIVLLSGCLMMAIISNFALPHINKTQVAYNSKNLRFVSDYPSKSIIWLAIFTIIFMFLRIAAFGIDNLIGDSDNQEDFAAGGFSGHILVLQIFLATHIGGSKINVKSVLLLICLFICLYAYNVKVWILAPVILSLIIHRDLHGLKVNIFWFVLAPILIFVLFSLSYIISLGWSTESLEFIWAHFFKYIFAGIGGLNEALIGNYPIGKVPGYGTPTFLNLIFGFEQSLPYQYRYVVINDINDEWSNVFSLIGGAYLLNGPLLGLLYLAIIGFISYKLYLLKLKNNNYWYYLAYYIWAIGLILSFFANYYTLMNIWELTFYALFVGYVKQHKFI